MLDVSTRREVPGKAIVYMDGVDARVYKNLLKKLGSEERLQNAIILSGLLTKANSSSEFSHASVKRIKSGFNETVGISFEEFTSLVEST